MGDVPEGADVVLGFDASYSGDATAIVAVQLPHGKVPHLDVVRPWEPPGGGPDSQVPIVDVEDAPRKAARNWPVQTIVADPSAGHGSNGSSPTRATG